MDEQGNAENLGREIEQLKARIDELNRERAYWKTLALENHQSLLAEQQARSEAEQALHNANFLARASAYVSGVFDYSANLDWLLRLVADEFADWAAVDLLNEEGNNLVRIALASKNATQEEFLWDSYKHYPVNLKGSHPVAQTLRDKKAVLVQNAGQTAFSAGIELQAPNKEAVNSPANQSYILVPLMAGGEILGVFIFVRLTGERPFNDPDLALAEDLSSKVALMIQNSRLYERLEKALENQQELNYYKDLYLSILSHELRNPLASIRGYTQIVWRSLTSRQKAAFVEPDLAEKTGPALVKEAEGQPKYGLEFDKEFRALSILINQADRMNRMVNELLDFSKIQKNSFELNYLTTVDLVDLLRRIVEEQTLAVKTHFFEIVAEQPEIKGIFDESRLEQVFNNLISNAIKYSPNNTTVKITLNLQPTESLVEDAPDYALIAIQDQGQGMDKEDQAHLFERYYRVRTEKNRMVQGLGLGLYICKEIVRQHHGEIWVESEPEGGSTFYVSLPLKPLPTGFKQAQ